MKMKIVNTSRKKINIFSEFYFFSFFPQTPLHKAAFRGFVECTNTLLQHGADVNVKNVRSERVCESDSHKRRDLVGFCVIY